MDWITVAMYVAYTPKLWHIILSAIVPRICTFLNITVQFSGPWFNVIWNLDLGFGYGKYSLDLELQNHMQSLFSSLLCYILCSCCFEKLCICSHDRNLWNNLANNWFSVFLVLGFVIRVQISGVWNSRVLFEFWRLLFPWHINLKIILNLFSLIPQSFLCS